MLEARKLSLGYGVKPVLEKVSYSFEPARITAIVGPNGCGKSTFLKGICRLLRPRGGTVLLEGADIARLPTREVARKVGLLPQSVSVPGDFTVEQVVSLGRYPHLGWRERLQEQDTKMVTWALETTGMQKMAGRFAGTLSGGERQRMWVAALLCQQPKFFLLDEPTTHLDISYQFELLELLKELNEVRKLTILLVLHDLNQAARYAHRVMMMKDGEIFKEGEPAAVFTRENIRFVFNIEADIMEDTAHGCPVIIPLGKNRNGGYRI